MIASIKISPEPNQSFCNWQAWKIAKALGISEFRNLARFDTLQAYYSIASRDLEREIVPLLESEKVGLLVWSPLAGGLLSGKFSRTKQKAVDSRRTDYDFPIVDKERTWKILDVMAPIAKAHGCSPARVALAWLLAKPVVTSIIIGAKRLDQLQDNLAAIELALTQDQGAFQCRGFVKGWSFHLRISQMMRSRRAAFGWAGGDDVPFS
jgi:aryl-alcohol dehydrogenase-like predicted oxidoreductase